MLILESCLSKILKIKTVFALEGISTIYLESHLGRNFSAWIHEPCLVCRKASTGVSGSWLLVNDHFIVYFFIQQICAEHLLDAQVIV